MKPNEKLLTSKLTSVIATSYKKAKARPLTPYEFKLLIQNQKSKLHIRKNQFDFTVAIAYGLNLSLIHFAMFVMIAFVVHWPDQDQAKKFDQMH